MKLNPTKSLALASYLFMLGAAAAQTTSAIIPWELRPSGIEIVKKAVLRLLKDPESARFGEDFPASIEGDIVHICGFVNSKNSFGGYTGNQPFYAIGSQSKEIVEVVLIGGSATDQKTTIMMCKMKGVIR